jgi:cation diffusion facilitator family transporter
MHTENLTAWMHDHVFDQSNAAAERSTRLVMWLTAAMMVIEIAAGWWFNSMALLADGWHMSSHAVAIGLSAVAYASARQFARDPRFAFGTWKIEILGGFASAIFLLGVALMMVFGSLERILAPQPIQYLEAIVVACLGLAVNLVSALILGQAHHQGHGHDHGHPHHHPHHHEHGHDHALHHPPAHALAHDQDQDQDQDHAHDQDHGYDHEQAHHHPHQQDQGHGHGQHEDLNLKSAYLHVIADAATSVLAIIALFGGWLYGWTWLDPAMGILGAILVGRWAKGLLIATGKVLLDREMDHPVVDEIRDLIETPDDAAETRLTDLHVWRVGRNAYACALTVVTHDPQLTATQIRQRLAIHEEIVHATIEVHRCPEAEAPPHLASA